MTDNGTIEALAALVRSANLTREQRQQLGYLSRKGPNVGTRDKRGKRHAKSGPYAHCKPGDAVTVAFPDGVMMKMNVWKCGPNAMRISDLDYAALADRAEKMRARVARYGRMGCVSPLEKGANALRQQGLPLPPESK
jgi:hypothetical protein